MLSFQADRAEPTSATSVVYNAAAGLFFAALRYHGFYSSPDGSDLDSTRRSAGRLQDCSVTTACPQNYLTSCPIYPRRNHSRAWTQ